MTVVTVDLGARSYPVRIEAGLLARAGEQLATIAKGRRVPIPATLGAMKAALEAQGIGFVEGDAWGVTGRKLDAQASKA